MIYTKDLIVPSQLGAVLGLPGVGKSTAAQLIAKQLDAVLLRSDVIRKEIYPNPRYTPEEGQHVYQVMFEQAVDLLTRRRSVVLDATFRSADLRRQMRQIAQNAGVLCRLVLVSAPEEVIRERLSARHNDPSDADFETYLQLQREFETIHEPHDVIENSGTLAELTVKVDKIFRV